MSTVRTVRRAPPPTEDEQRTGDLQLAIAALATIATGATTPPFWAQFAFRAIKAFRSRDASNSRAFHLRMIQRTNAARAADAAATRRLDADAARAVAGAGAAAAARWQR